MFIINKTILQDSLVNNASHTPVHKLFFLKNFISSDVFSSYETTLQLSLHKLLLNYAEEFADSFTVK